MADSNITIKAMAEGLKKLTHEKPFDKISVKDITDECGINRQTFYYHFKDKFELLEWIYHDEIFETAMQDITFENWEEKLDIALNVMISNKQFYVNTINHSEDYLQRYLIEQTKKVFHMAIDQLDEEKHVNEEQRDFIAKFFAYGACGMIIEWVSQGMIKEPEFIAANMHKLLTSCENAGYLFVTDEIFERNKSEE